MYRCKYCGALVEQPKKANNNYHFECENCGKCSTFAYDLFEIVEDKERKNADKADSDFEYWWRGYYKKKVKGTKKWKILK